MRVCKLLKVFAMTEITLLVSTCPISDGLDLVFMPGGLLRAMHVPWWKVTVSGTQ